MLVGRERELEQLLEGCRSAAAGRGSVILLAGEPGIGKSALLSAVVDGPDWRVLRGTGVEAERAIAFATLQGLLWPVREDVDKVDRSQARLLHGVLDLGPPGNASTFAVGAATLALLSVASRLQPLVVVVDDVHWADPASAEVLAFLGRRHQPRVVADGEICLDPQLERGKPELPEPGDLGLRPRLVTEVAQRLAPEQRQRLPQALCRQTRLLFQTSLDQLLEAIQVKLAFFQSENIAATQRLDPTLAELGA
jgi:hypothetical protein